MENFNLSMEKIIEAEKKSERKPKLLLHSCCAPCSSYCIERLKEIFDITVYYYNPNIDSQSEFDLRKTEQARLCDEMGVKYILEEFSSKDFHDKIVGLEGEKEGGKRCEVCFLVRLEQTAKKAKQLSFDYFSTTLTISPLKNARLINEIGVKVQQEIGVKFLPSDFKKKGGYLRSIELSKEYNLYRQNYCGCEFSKKKI